MRGDRAQAAQDRFRGRTRTACLVSRSSRGYDLGIEVEERHLLELVGDRVVEQLPQRAAGDRPAPSPAMTV